MRGLRGESRHGEAAFTLLEVMLAIVIFAVVITILYQSFQQSLLSSEALRQKRDLYETGRVTMDRIREDLTGAVIFPSDTRTRFMGSEDKDTAGNRMDVAGFSSLAHIRFNPAAAESDLCEVAYGYQVDSETGVRSLVRREDATLDDDPTTGGTAYPLVEGVKSLSLRYYDGVEWKESWSSTEAAQATTGLSSLQQAQPKTQKPSDKSQGQAAPANQGKLPLAVEVRLVLNDPQSGDLTFADIVRLPLAKPPSQVPGMPAGLGLTQPQSPGGGPGSGFSLPQQQFKTSGPGGRSAF